MVFLMGDLDFPVRDRTYREPEGPHVVMVRGRDLEDALAHLAARPDCRALAVLGLPREPPDPSVLNDRRLLVADADQARVHDFAEVALEAGADVEWLHSMPPPFDRLAAWALPVGGVVLAAGKGSRMGRNKLLLDLGGQPLVRHVVEAASNGGCHQVVVVYADPDVKEELTDSTLCILNPDAASGIASSLRRGLGALGEEIAGALVLLGDQPLVGARTVDLLLRAWRREGARPAVAAAYHRKDRWRPPVLLHRSLWPELMALEGDSGARQVLDQRPELLDTVLAHGRDDDVDTPEDYAKIVRLFPRPDPQRPAR